MDNDESTRKINDFDARGYSLSGKIMLSAIILLFFIVLLMLFLHLYARWYLLRARRRHLRNRRLRRTELVVYHDSDNPAAARGLDASLIASLPVFSYDPTTQQENPPECAVCLSEFEAGETGRVLPKCNHSFHTECIDMWFHSHSTCPLCRATVDPPQTRSDLFITVCEPEPGSGSGLCLEDENRAGREVSSSSVGLRRKPSFVRVTVEVPARNESFRDARNESFRDESDCDSPSTQSSFRSPMSRMMSFKRILSRERKGSVSPSSSGGGGCSSAAEFSTEQGGRDETQ
ncbi:RING-H2 finger protein ATL2-like [Gastrolobium bilobum]|uniref:RING-H2 finger protein ATL2-like n=1 Tax=Gastrolobium bilobum TaxID=150636 RepID=UPI002AB1CE06|nr:RING-H2 finger protein ATL2-like [Gastrolobium bilobum]